MAFILLIVLPIAMVAIGISLTANAIETIKEQLEKSKK